LKKCELDEIYDRVTISAEVKFLTVSIATFATTNKRYTALLVCSYNPPQNSITIATHAKLL